MTVPAEQAPSRAQAWLPGRTTMVAVALVAVLAAVITWALTRNTEPAAYRTEVITVDPLVPQVCVRTPEAQLGGGDDVVCGWMAPQTQRSPREGDVVMVRVHPDVIDDQAVIEIVSYDD